MTQSQARGPPLLLTSLGDADTAESILAVVADERHIYAGSQDCSIHVWDAQTLDRQQSLVGHARAVLCLELSGSPLDRLFSSSGDNTVRVWDTRTLTNVMIVEPPHDNVGDIFSLVWLRQTSTLFMGCQCAAIQWLNVTEHVREPSTPLPIRYNKFFDSLSLPERARASQSPASSRPLSPTLSANAAGLVTPNLQTSTPHHQIEAGHVRNYAHNGYIYSLAVTHCRVGQQAPAAILASGSGDSLVKLWECQTDDISHIATLRPDAGAVLALAVAESTLYSGHQAGALKIWDLETLTCIRTLKTSDADVLALSLLGGHLFCGRDDGMLVQYSKAFEALNAWQAHSGILLATTALHDHSGAAHVIISGGSDNVLKLWDVTQDIDSDGLPFRALSRGQMLQILRGFVSFPSISSKDHREDCRQSALYLRDALENLGANARLLAGDAGKNPLVLATFKAVKPTSGRLRKRVLFYGHYDVVEEGRPADWHSPAFELTGRDGYLYGRGVSDNKGPIVACASAVSSLREQQELDVDFVMLIEGEEESGSTGFAGAVKANSDLIGSIDVILISNSYWIGENIPCMTFGLRGVIRATLEIASSQPDLHAGMQGGAVHEPLIDLIKVLATLLSKNEHVNIAHFYDAVRDLEADELALYHAVVDRTSSGTQDTQSTALQYLLTRWRQPSLSIHDIAVGGSRHSTVIPHQASASLSVRIVPDQQLGVIQSAIRAHLQAEFEKLASPNEIHIRFDHTADWWLGSVTDKFSRAFVQALDDVYQIEPLWIREGGSIPALPFLTKHFGVSAVHFPMGASSDSAHLPNERIKLAQLEHGHTVIERWLRLLSEL
ncbi:hypothetical protein E5Q_00143 [Mixia osmundae IAM 14324]|uniref:Peptidase M20 dimerisation domain-containing protein n=1 Tax=Mixia osmundae (strain CBS 9802 / IAM 14324 / JCM 22182 / KY 12970) TaxID=764103 RepID=G7DSE2_MIXOS|nr:hypothetical protein E5Q_00143 [Mixia osmundae IAM 14324]